MLINGTQTIGFVPKLYPIKINKQFTFTEIDRNFQHHQNEMKTWKISSNN